MIATIWQYRVLTAHILAFERIYGPEGAWAALFSQTPGYVGAELLKTDSDADVYLSVNWWVSEFAYKKAMHQIEVERVRLEDLYDEMTSEERLLGIHHCIGACVPKSLAA
jgi:heme-degrading monooxygenase HmoA